MEKANPMVGKAFDPCGLGQDTEAYACRNAIPGASSASKCDKNAGKGMEIYPHTLKCGITLRMQETYHLDRTG